MICLKRKLVNDHTTPSKRLLTIEEKMCIKCIYNRDYPQESIGKILNIHPKTVQHYRKFREQPRKYRAKIRNISDEKFIEAIKDCEHFINMSHYN